MAKGKKGPALFEVIRAAQQKQLEQQHKLAQQRAAGPGVLTTAASKLQNLKWLRGRDSIAPVEHHDAPVMREIPTRQADFVEAAPASQRQVETIIERPASASPVYREVAPVEAVVAQPPEPVIEVRASPVRPVVTYTNEPAPTPADDIARRVREEIAAASRMKDTYDDVSPDPVYNNVADLFGTQNREDEVAAGTGRSFKFPIPFTYTTGLAAGIGMLLIVSLIVIFAKIGTGGESKGALADAKLRPDVLEVKTQGGSGQGNVRITSDGEIKVTAPSIKQLVKPTDDKATAMARAGQTQPHTVGVESAFAPVTIPTNGKRIIGVQYVVLLSFPRQEPADELVKFLTGKGVQVTAEKGLPGYSKTWYSVVTKTGFQRTIDNPQYDAFIAPINKLMKEFANGSKFKSFKPDIYTWRAAS